MQFVKDDRPVLIRTVGPGAGEEITSVDDDDIRITLSGNMCEAFFKKLFVRIEIVFYPGVYMNYDIYVPRSFCRNAVGHLGNCDDDASNDASGLENGKFSKVITCSLL